MIDSTKDFSQIKKNTTIIFCLIKCFFDCFSKINWWKGGRVFLSKAKLERINNAIIIYKPIHPTVHEFPKIVSSFSKIFFMDRNDFSRFWDSWKASCCKEKLLNVNERFHKLASWLEISFLSSFEFLVGILYGPVALVVSGDKQIILISSFSIGMRKKELGFLFVRCNFCMNNSVGFSADSIEKIIENICNSFWIINSFILKSK